MRSKCLVSLYFLGLLVISTLFREYANVASMAISLRIVVVVLGFAVMLFGVYLAYRVTREPKQIRS